MVLLPRLKILLLLTIFSIIFTTTMPAAYGQELHPNVETGIQAYYEAQFDKALTILTDVILSGELDQTSHFEAQKYIAFTLVRKNEPDHIVARAFDDCVRIDPTRTLDVFKTPPVLLAKFNDARTRLLGSLHIISAPEHAQIHGIHDRTKNEISGTTPLFFDALLAGSYTVTLTLEKYKDKTVSFDVRPASTDTVRIDLLPESTSFLKKWWVWTGGGVVAAATVAAILISQKESKPKESGLPYPPVRPQ